MFIPTSEALIACYLFSFLLLLTDEIIKALGQEGTCPMSHSRSEAQQDAESKFSHFWLVLHGATLQLKLLVILPRTLPCSPQVPGTRLAARRDTKVQRVPFSTTLGHSGRKVLLSAGREPHAESRAVNTVLAQEPGDSGPEPPLLSCSRLHGREQMLTEHLLCGALDSKVFTI